MTDDFAFEYGTWSVAHRRLLTRLAQGTEWEHFDGITICAPILGGVGNFEQVWMPTIDTIGMALRLFDQTTREWAIYWSSNTTGQLEPPVIGRFVDGVGVFESDDELDGAPIRVRFVWDHIGDDRARWTQSFRRPDDRAWEANWIMDFTRVSHEAPAATSPA